MDAKKISSHISSKDVTIYFLNEFLVAKLFQNRKINIIHSTLNK